MSHDEKLVSKLGLKPGKKNFTLHAPKDYSSNLPYIKKLDSLEELSNKCDWIQAFYDNGDQLELEIESLKQNLINTGQLWVSWPKKSSGVQSDLSDRSIREIGLRAGLVDVKIVSVNDIWSGLKFVYRVVDR